VRPRPLRHTNGGRRTLARIALIGAALAAPALSRRHEAGGRPWAHAPQVHLPREKERALLERGCDTLAEVTGTRPKGFKARVLRGSANTLPLLAALDLICTIDGPSRD